MQSQDVDAFAELDKANGTTEVHGIAPTAPVSEMGLPLIPRSWISDLAPDKVSDSFYGWVLSTVERGGADWDLTCLRLHALPQKWRLIYTILWLQAEVDNGGHEQFFSHGQGEFDDETEADLRFIGADQFLKLFSEARRFYYDAPTDDTERIPEVEPIDDAFYQQRKSLYVLVGEYVLSHLEDYCVD
ncbi:MAG: DUF4375 domain-containing protein [Verrucomicrobiota bacterium]